MVRAVALQNGNNLAGSAKAARGGADRSCRTVRSKQVGVRKIAHRSHLTLENSASTSPEALILRAVALWLLAFFWLGHHER